MKLTKSIPTPDNWQALKYHPLSSLVEFGAGIDLDQLAAHMRANGYDEDEPIILLDGQVFDGRHRHGAAIRAEVVPTFREFTGKDPVAYVTKKVLRQHLDESQRAMLGAKLATLREGRPTKTTATAAVSQGEHTAIAVSSQGQVAELLNISEDSIQRAKKVQEQGTPKLQQAVSDGTVSVSDAAKVAAKPAPVQNQAVAEVKAGRAATASQAADRQLCVSCRRCVRVGMPLPRLCSECDQLNQLSAKPSAPPAPNATPKPDPKPEDDAARIRREYLESAKEALMEATQRGSSGQLTMKQAEVVLAELARRPMEFVVPTLSEVRDYCKSRKNQVNPSQFLAHYESNGWKVGKNPMKDWKGAVRTWEHTQEKFGKANGKPGLFAGMAAFMAGEESDDPS